MEQDVFNEEKSYANVSMVSSLRMAMKKAEDARIDFGVIHTGTEIMIYGFLCVAGFVQSLFAEYGVTAKTYLPHLKATFINSQNRPNGYTPNLKSAFYKAREKAIATKRGYVAEEHVLAEILSMSDVLGTSVLKTMAVPVEEIMEKVCAEINRQQNGDDENVYTSRTSGRYEYEPYEKLEDLKDFGYDLTKKAYEGKLDPVIGRNKETEKIIQILSRRTKNSPILIGEPGVGKSAVIEGLAQEIVAGRVPDVLRGKTIFSLDLSSMLAGSKFRGEFEERFKKAINFIMASGDIIVFIDEIHNIMGAGATGEGSMDASEILKPMLARGEFQIIGATTTEEYGKYIEKNSAFARRFQEIKVNAPSIDDTIKILMGLRDKYEAHHRVAIKDEAIISAVKLSERYITDRYLPDKAIDVIDEASARAKLQACAPQTDLRDIENNIKDLLREREYALHNGREQEVKKIESDIAGLREELDKIQERQYAIKSNTRPFIDGEDVAKIIGDRTGIPLTKLNQEDSDRLMNLEAELHSRVIGQEDAIAEVAKAIRRSRAGLSDPNRPIGSFIFAGPTGVGKTELTKALAELMFGNENMLIRIDMSEYMEKHTVSKLIGAPPGYAGYEEEGILTGKVRRMPYSVVLFDEIEKAHPDVFDIMLQILDDGRLTDSRGRVIDFKNTVIIMTSNCGADISSNNFNDEVIENSVNEALKERFRPEFLNRIDKIVVFRRLTKLECAKIADILLTKLKKRLEEKNIKLTISMSAVELILKMGYSEIYGARPLKRAMQRLLEDMLADEIISGGIVEGDVINVYADGDILDYAKCN